MNLNVPVLFHCFIYKSPYKAQRLSFKLKIFIVLLGVSSGGRGLLGTGGLSRDLRGDGLGLHGLVCTGLNN